MGGNDPTGEKIEDVLPGIEKGLLEKTSSSRGELHHRQGDTYRIYNLESYPIKDDNDAISFKSIVLKDVADERALEEENIYKDRMESIGKLAGGVAHDFNNVLTGILGYASLVKKMAPKEGHLGRYAEVIENSAKRAASLTEHLLNFSRRQRDKDDRPGRPQQPARRRAVPRPGELQDDQGGKGVRGAAAAGQRRCRRASARLPQPLRQCKRRDGRGRHAHDKDRAETASDVRCTSPG